MLRFRVPLRVKLRALGLGCLRVKFRALGLECSTLGFH